MIKNEIKHIIFDLDDTLFDTYGQLVLPATFEACEVMVKNGLNCDINLCVQKRAEFLKTNCRENIFDLIVKSIGVVTGSSENLVAQAGRLAFHKRRIKEDIVTFKDTYSVLKNLRSKFKIYLVTLGDPGTQSAKISLLELDSMFEQIIISDINKDENKKSAFSKLLFKTQDKPQTFLSIGNRIDTDIRFAKELGMRTVLYNHGEYLNLKPEVSEEIPDKTVKSLTEFKEWLEVNF